jgi:ribonuclease P protein component
MTILVGDKKTIVNKTYKRVKLTKTDEFSSVFDFRRRISSEHLVLHFKPNNLARARLGLVASKKVSKTAVSRNYMRRVLRSFFYAHQSSLCPCDLIVQARKKFGRADFKNVQDQFDKLVKKLLVQYEREFKLQLTNHDSLR